MRTHFAIFSLAAVFGMMALQAADDLDDEGYPTHLTDKQKKAKEQKLKRQVYHPYEEQKCDLGQCDSDDLDEDEDEFAHCGEFEDEEECQHGLSLFDEAEMDNTWPGRREDSFYDSLTR